MKDRGERRREREGCVIVKRDPRICSVSNRRIHLGVCVCVCVCMCVYDLWIFFGESTQVVVDEAEGETSVHQGQTALGGERDSQD